MTLTGSRVVASQALAKVEEKLIKGEKQLAYQEVRCGRCRGAHASCPPVL